MKCDDNDIYACKNGVWELDKSCDTFEVCVELSNKSAICEADVIMGEMVGPDECAAGDKKCDDNSIFACDGGRWVLESACDAGSVCVQVSNSSAVCEVDLWEGEPMPPEMPDDPKA